MLSNFWKGLSFFCMNGHEQPVKMVYQEGSSVFLACPKYMLADSRHPDGHIQNEAACPNRLSYSDAERIVSMLSDTVQETLAQDDFCDFTGYRFKMRQITVEVLSYADGDIRLGIVSFSEIESPSLLFRRGILSLLRKRKSNLIRIQQARCPSHRKDSGGPPVKGRLSW